MARKGTELVLWDKQLAEAAKAAAGVVAGLGGAQFFSLRGGTLKLGDSAIPNNEVVGIVLAQVLENALYTADFDPDNPATPTCYAFGTVAGSMAPHEAAKKKVSDLCERCEYNQFGSAEKGRGKACKNRVRLAVIPAGTLVQGRFEPTTDPDAVSSAQVVYLGVPPTSLGAWGAYVKSLSTNLKRPPWAVFTKIRVQPDQKTQLSVTFECMAPCGPQLATVLTRRSQEAQDGIVFAYPEREELPKKKKAKRRKF